MKNLHTMTRAKMQSTIWEEVHLTAVMAQALHDKHTPALLLLLLQLLLLLLLPLLLLLALQIEKLNSSTST